MFEFTKEQKQAMAQFKRAWTRLKKADLYLHNCYGTLIAYPGDKVDDVDDIPTETEGVRGDCEDRETVIDDYPGEWADDAHFIHYLDEESMMEG